MLMMEMFCVLYISIWIGTQQLLLKVKILKQRVSLNPISVVETVVKHSHLPSKVFASVSVPS